MVYSGIYPINTADYEHSRPTSLNFSSTTQHLLPAGDFSSPWLWFPLRFLGLLHLEIVQERLRREFEMDIIATYPNVVYQVTLTDGAVEEIDNPAHLPAVNHIETIEEPMVKSFIICPNDYIGDMWLWWLRSVGSSCTPRRWMDPGSC